MPKYMAKRKLNKRHTYFNANAIAAEELYALARNNDGTALETVH